MQEPDDNKMEFCLDCGSSRVTESNVKHDFQYGADINTCAILSAIVPVFHCAECNYAFTDYRAGDARERVVAEYLRNKANSLNISSNKVSK